MSVVGWKCTKKEDGEKDLVQQIHTRTACKWSMSSEKRRKIYEHHHHRCLRRRLRRHSPVQHTINDNDAKLNVIMCNTFAKTCDNAKIVSAATFYGHIVVAFDVSTTFFSIPITAASS